MTYALIYKDPVENLSLSLDWTDWLEGDTISASTWTANAGLTVIVSQFNATAATAVVSSGSLGDNYALFNTITTTSGRVSKRTIIVRITSK